MNRLVWSLVVATYNRSSVLVRCVRLAALQTRLPEEIVIVDASDDWENSKAHIDELLKRDHPQIRLIYKRATVPSSTAQRNQGVDLATGDVVFLIDDDSLMYPNCAEKILEVYEADVNCTVQGVSAVNFLPPPDEAQPSGATEESSRPTRAPQQTALRRLFKAILRTTDTYFLPYESPPPEHEIDPAVMRLNVGRISVMAGYAMTFRREVALRERFCETLLRYAAGEDQDLSYRVSRHGALVNAIDAHLCHLEVMGARPSRYKIAAVASLNPAVLHQIYATDLVRVNRQWQKIVRKRLLINAMKDLSEREWRFARTRGVLFALKKLPDIRARSGEDLKRWYLELQNELYSAARD